MNTYNRSAAAAYAHKWAYGRNPRYYDFEAVGGDCTNFISQCIYAGCGVMNYTKDTGWFYNTQNSRSAAWSGVPYLYNFLTKNKGPGPYGHEASLKDVSIGDVIQLNFTGGIFSHSLLVVDTGKDPAPDNILIATHSFDSDYRPLDTYEYFTHRAIVIDGARK